MLASIPRAGMESLSLLLVIYSAFVVPLQLSFWQARLPSSLRPPPLCPSLPPSLPSPCSRCVAFPLPLFSLFPPPSVLPSVPPSLRPSPHPSVPPSLPPSLLALPPSLSLLYISYSSSLPPSLLSLYFLASLRPSLPPSSLFLTPSLPPSLLLPIHLSSIQLYPQPRSGRRAHARARVRARPLVVAHPCLVPRAAVCVTALCFCVSALLRLPAALCPTQPTAANPKTQKTQNTERARPGAAAAPRGRAEART